MLVRDTRRSDDATAIWRFGLALDPLQAEDRAMRIACLNLLLLAAIVLGAPILAAYLHASIWWLLPVALLLALLAGWARDMASVGLAPGFAFLWLFLLPAGLAFLMLGAVYWLAERLLF
jgi:hypothetical protein